MTSAQPTHYQTLNVAPGATQEAIRKAYRSIAKQLHPDVNAEAGAQARFAAVAIAYEVLSDPEQRREYDLQLQKHALPKADLRAHYTWTNVAAAAPEHPDPGELDEIYDTFFGPKTRGKAGPEQAPQPAKPGRKPQRG